jgi:hypothetical protein
MKEQQRNAALDELSGPKGCTLTEKMGVFGLTEIKN